MLKNLHYFYYNNSYYNYYYNSHKTLSSLAILSTTLSSLFYVISSLTDLHHNNVQAHLFIYSGCSPNNSNIHLHLFLAIILQQFRCRQRDLDASRLAAYGLYQCRGDLKITDCSACIQSGLSQIGLVCPNSYGGRIQLDGCLIRYENSNFLGKLDTTLVFKKCSQSTSNDVEFYRRRDDVLADLQGAASFRVSSSGLVEGFAQCLGDLNQADCTSCLADAVGKLKYVCGSAAAVDVYLAECYARYWAAGYYESGGSSEDQIGKTVAIIVGVLAGLAVLVVLLSFLRKVADRPSSIRFKLETTSKKGPFQTGPNVKGS
ncbi:hypothetical protein Syun_018264 [Stephania yunnanensis]|uniref:Gnk2-homologous domain-containing protein n=1 Tax=Stephania yunnanensis TaxID=152371 RepID=A0AAP0ITV0_9MAGN